jgi:hypothetical protein
MSCNVNFQLCESSLTSLTSYRTVARPAGLVVTPETSMDVVDVKTRSEPAQYAQTRHAFAAGVLGSNLLQHIMELAHAGHREVALTREVRPRRNRCRRCNSSGRACSSTPRCLPRASSPARPASAAQRACITRG